MQETRSDRDATTGTVDPWNPRLWVRERGGRGGRRPKGEEKGEDEGIHPDVIKDDGAQKALLYNVIM
jgi:hypothetical protein